MMRTMRERKQSQFNEGSDDDFHQSPGYANPSPKKVIGVQQNNTAYGNTTFSPQKMQHGR
jgi:hypothetical protein